MAGLDILKGLLGAAGGGFQGHAVRQQEERARTERTAERDLERVIRGNQIKQDREWYLADRAEDQALAAQAATDNALDREIDRTTDRQRMEAETQRRRGELAEQARLQAERDEAQNAFQRELIGARGAADTTSARTAELADVRRRAWAGAMAPMVVDNGVDDPYEREPTEAEVAERLTTMMPALEMMGFTAEELGFGTPAPRPESQPWWMPQRGTGAQLRPTATTSSPARQVEADESSIISDYEREMGPPV